MFSTLPESHPIRRRRRPGIAVSSAMHAVVIWGAVYATATAHPSAPSRPPESIVYVAPPVHPAPFPRTPVPDGIVPDMPTIPVPPIGPISEPTPMPFAPPVLENPDPGPFTGGATDATPEPGTGGSPTSAPGHPFIAAEVDRVAAPRAGAPAPAYPGDLQSAGIEGVVSVEFVVDSTGRADAHLVRIVASDYPAFSAAVRDAIGRTRYFPAEVRGRHVAQLVDQSFVFRITR